jgi:carboxypeptidase A2/carboxypeptidase A1
VAAFSEPETQVMRNFIIANPRIKTTMDWHSYGYLAMGPWGYTDVPVTPPATAAMFQTLYQGMVDAMFAVHGKVYTPGPINPTLYAANGVSVDWSWGARGILGLTIELRGTNFELPPSEIVPTCEETWPAFLYIANYLTPCYPDCDGAGGLTANDFQCFLNAYAGGQSYADCDGAGGLTANDFQCFLDSYVSGCP